MTTRITRSTAIVTLAVLIVVGVGACAGGDDAESAATRRSTTSDAPTTTSVSSTTSNDASDPDGSGATSGNTPGGASPAGPGHAGDPGNPGNAGNPGKQGGGDTGGNQTPGAAAPTIVSFTTPESIDCHNGNFQQFSANWETTNATKVTISIDGPGVYGSYGPSGTTDLPFNCSSSHTFLLTAYGADNAKVTKQVTLQPRNVQSATGPDASE